MSGLSMEVPEGFDVVPESRTGYAIGPGQLLVNQETGEFRLALEIREMTVTIHAIEDHPDTSNVLKEGFDGADYQGDLSAQKQIVDALQWYENHRAGLGEDKIAYDTRTAFNHAYIPIKEAHDAAYVEE